MAPAGANILVVADVFGRPGRRAVAEFVPLLRERHSIDFCIANGENAAGGRGITAAVAQELLSAGVDVITGGNHIWDHSQIMHELDYLEEVLRPANYPEGVPGRGFGIFEGIGSLKVAVLNLQGRTFMAPIDCPFRASSKYLSLVPPDVRVVIVDFHAEATAEKVAMGWYLQGQVSAVIGTHTHVPTADERILPRGTAYITDVGMTGPFDSVIGVEKEQVFRKFLTQLPTRYPAAKGDVRLNAVLVSVDRETGRATGISRIEERLGRES